jgi:DnaJ-class molecular chaperone
MTNHYEILGVPKDVDATEIKKAYRKLSLKYHPDRNPDPEATEKYKAINEAHEILSDPQKREQYNMELQFGSMPNGMQQPGEMNDIFNMMFGGFPGGGFPGGGPNIRVFHSGGFPGGGFPGGGIEQLFQQMSRPPPISKQISITLEQAYSGITVQFDIERATIHNNTRVQEIENMTIAIPPGIQENETILINGQGNCGLNNNRGDIHITVKIVNNTIFTRNDMDLTHTKHISLKEALCGFGFEIHHLNGKLINMNNITNPSIIKPNYKKVVPGLGMNKNNQTGNLIIELLVDFPNSLTEQQIEGLRNIL